VNNNRGGRSKKGGEREGVPVRCWTFGPGEARVVKKKESANQNVGGGRGIVHGCQKGTFGGGRKREKNLRFN